MKSPRLFLLTLTILSSPWVCSARTSGTLATETNVNWTTAPWTITSGTGTYPNGGGTATLNTVTNVIIGTPSPALTLDAPITLSGLTYNTPFSQTIAGAASFDELKVSGLFTLDGTVNAATLGGFMARLGMSFNLVDFESFNVTGFNAVINFNFSGA